MSRTDAQQRAITAELKMLCVDAGAGSGKTLVLVERIVHLIAEKKADLDDIVAITFTDKAAAEMKARLRRAFREKAPIDDPGEMTRWRDLERRVETARIGTIHSFCARLLREHALRIGMDPDFTVLTEAETVLLRNETAIEAVHERLEATDPAAMRAATEYGPATLIDALDALLAKRGVLDRLEADLPLDDPDALAERWADLARAAHEQRLKTFARSHEVRLWIERIESFDGLCEKPTDGREVKRLEQIDLLEKLRNAENIAAINTCLAGMAAPPRQSKSSKDNWQTEAAYVGIGALFDTIKKRAQGLVWTDPDPVIEARAAQLTCDLYAMFEHVRGAFSDAKAARAAMDFDDLIASAWRMLRENESVRTRVARGIRFLLVDEFQDTDWIQLDIARMLVDEPGGPDWFFVGDAKQSIYDFRGAEVEVFQKQRTTAEEVVPLARNFRTVPEIIDFVNDVFARTGLLEAVEAEYSAIEPHRPAANEPRIAFLVPRKREEKANVEDYRRDEADLIAWRIEEMCVGPNRVMVGSDDTRPAEYGDVAILLRTFSNVHLYEEGLRRRSIPFSVVAGVGFYERQEIIDLRNLLGVVVNPWDEGALLGFLRGPLAGLSDDALAVMRRMGSVARTFWSNPLPADAPEAELLERARALASDLRGHQDLPLPAFMRYVLDATKHEAILLEQYLGGQKAWNVRKAADLAENFARTQPARLPAFVHYLEKLVGQEVREGDAAVQSRGAVTLMTVHKAKGLEFPIVVLADSGRELDETRMGLLAVHRDIGLAARVTGDDGESAKPAVYTAIRNARNEKEMAEHARVLYVGMTRARDWLLFGGTPAPGTNSWLETLDDAYCLLDRNNGGVVETEKWSAIVWRDRVAHVATPSEDRVLESLDVDALVRRAEPVIVPAIRRTISVSAVLDAMVGAHDDDEPHRESNDDFAPTFAMKRGTLVHRLFECWTPGTRMDVGAFLARECPALNLCEMLVPDLEGILQRFETGALALRMTSAKRIEREAPFLLRIDATLVSGTIDALIDNRIVVDYKTGRPRAALHERYEWQLRLYAAAVRSLLGITPTEALLYYADLGEERAVDIGVPYMDEALDRAAAAIESIRIPVTNQSL